MRADFSFSRFTERSDVVDYVGFAASERQQQDIRTACLTVAAKNNSISGPDQVKRYREIGAPLVFLHSEDCLEFWKQSREPQYLETVPKRGIASFFKSHIEDFDPKAICRAKVNPDRQLRFVDLGLMPFIEETIGKELCRIITLDTNMLEGGDPGNALLVFRLVAAKILRDRHVRGFCNLDFGDAGKVIESISKHYGVASRGPQLSHRQEDALASISQSIGKLADLSLVSTEALACVYENTLVTKATRKRWGTHSTPQFMIDYVVGKLRPWIEEIPFERRHVFEPACGHAGFLVAFVRLFREVMTDEELTASQQKAYLRSHIHGVEQDSFALEVAKLSLTLADIPNPNGWDLAQGDIFTWGKFQDQCRRAMIVVGNPPFESFGDDERERYSQDALTFNSKASETLHRTLKDLPEGGVFGFVMPQSVLNGRSDQRLREMLCRKFELKEICTFPDKVFENSDAETTILLGRKRGEKDGVSSVSYRRVFDTHEAVEKYRKDYQFSSVESIPQKKFWENDRFSLHVPLFEQVWSRLQHLPALGTLAFVVQGVIYESKDLPEGAETFSEERAPGFIQGFNTTRGDWYSHESPPLAWLSSDPDLMRHAGLGAETNEPRVLLNYATVRRGPWRLKACIDRKGRLATSRLTVVKPKQATPLPLEYLWALLNSPLVNAYAYSHLGKRDIPVGIVRKAPVPEASADQVREITKLVKKYFTICSKKRGRSEEEIRDQLLRIDAEVLRLYNLSPQDETTILKLFSGYSRKSVPCHFEGYFPKGMDSYYHLYEYLSDEFRKASTEEFLSNYHPIESPEMKEAFRTATESYRE